MKKVFLSAILMAGTAGVLSSCNDSTNDMTPQPQQGTFTVENVVQNKDFVQSGAFQGTGSATVQLPVYYRDKASALNSMPEKASD
ncbi:hypothetical protein [Elizabethkingia anophelis]|uniref:hypothetical protein n=1 Tax=Elizabethkingia anophelis TaxID=1117645 RepID=UPI000442C94C|nr:hypothetical protein [Elizabethkingia anophelis]CDN78886.1 exported hypothetical protein [Elizabethkingia anophelis]